MGRLSNIQHNNVSVKLTLLSSARAQERRPELRRIVGITVTVHLTGRAFLCRRPAAWSVSSISRPRIARRPVIGRPFAQPVGLNYSARSGRFVEPDQADATCPVPFAKIFLFPSDANHLHIPRHPGPHKGAFRDRHERWAGMRWTLIALLTRALICGRRSRVVLTPRRWRQVGGSNSANDGDNKARSPGRARNKLLKPLRAGMPGDPGATVVTNQNC